MNTSDERCLEHLNRLATVAGLLPNIQHEIGNALQVVSNCADLIGRAEAGGGPAKARAATIEAQVMRVSAQLQSLVELALAGSSESDVDLREVALRAVAMRGPSLRRIQAAAHVDAAEHLDWRVTGDRLAMLQLVVNLIENAENVIARRHPPTVWIALARRGDRVVLSVRDNGTGAPAELRARLSGAAAVSPGPGPALGLGLYVAGLIARRHGGTLELASGESDGSTFVLTLPAAGTRPV